MKHSNYTPGSESKTTCNLCERPPGGIHRDKCPRGKNFRRVDALRQKPSPPRGWPIANIHDCVGGPIKTKVIPPGTPSPVKL